MQPPPPPNLGDPALGAAAATSGGGGGHPGLSHPTALPSPYPHLQPHLQHIPHPPSMLANAAASAVGNGSPAPGGTGGADGAKTNGAPAPKGVKRTASGAAAGGGSGGGAAKEKKTRSKAACSACKSVKQKCEGPPYIPCRRCQLYKLECKFPPGTKTIPRPPEPGTAPVASGSGGAGGGGEPSAAVNEKLYEIAARLQSIESALHIHRAPSPPAHSHSSHSHHHASPSAHSSDAGEEEEDTSSVGRAAAAEANPLQEINATIESISGKPAPRMTQMDLADYGAPDVLRRGVLSPEECQQLFDFFFASLHPWVMMLSVDEDRNAMLTRSRSTLLFHTILLLSTAYSSPFPSQLHLTLVTFLNNIIAPQLLNPQPHELNTDFLRAMDLLTIYKPVQFGARRAEGVDDAEAMRCSKINGQASWMIQTIFSRTAERLDLASVVQKFSRAYSASASGTPIPQDLVRDLRLYYWLLSNDVHGNVQSGRRCNMEGAHALTTTRLFSSLNLQPYDVRLAASVEMFEVARPILRSYQYERTRRIPRQDLERFNQGMKSFDETWIPILLKQLSRDPLAMTVVCPFAAFITLQFNGTAFSSWKSNRHFAGSDSGGEGRPGTGSSEGRNKRLRVDGPRGLTDWEFDSLTRCVKAAEMLIFSLSEESRIPGAWRAVQWEEAERQDGFRKLILDDQVVATCRWGMDAITCVAYVFPLVFLSKLVNEGLMTTNLVLVRNPTPQPNWLHTQKLPRLIELGAAFLDAIATNEHHPSRASAHSLRTVLDTGVRGRLPSPGGPVAAPSPGPRNAATVMSPSPSQALPYIPPQPASYPDTVPPPQQPMQWAHPGAAPPPPQGYAFPGASGSTLPAPGPPPVPVLVPGMDEALGSVLNDFGPLFSETGPGFWDWNYGSGAGAGGAIPQPTPPANGIVGDPLAAGLPADWPGGIPQQPPHPYHLPQ